MRGQSLLFEHIQFAIQPERGIAYLVMSPTGYPCFSLGLLRELRDAQEKADEYGCKYLLLSSNIEGVFSFGGDLEYLSKQIRNKNRRALFGYMKVCIDALHYRSTVDGRVRIAVVQGDAFGGGFEAALCCDIIIAEEGVRFAFPESTFNLIPGMGAFNYLFEKVGASVTKRIIAGGRVHDAQAMFALGVLDQVVSSGKGMQAAEKYIRSYERHRNSYDAIRRIIDSLDHGKATYDELIRVGDV